MTLEQGRDLLTKGWTTKTVEVLGRKYTFRTVSASDMLLIQTLRESVISKRPNMTLETFSSIDTLIKLAVTLVEVDGETKGFFTPEQVERIAKVILGFDETEQEKAMKQVAEQFNEISAKYLLNLPVQAADKLANEFNSFLDEVKQAIESGELLKN
ncbi:MAG: hypothetical protein QXE80_03565 [Pyrobaculum sp.]